MVYTEIFSINHYKTLCETYFTKSTLSERVHKLAVMIPMYINFISYHVRSTIIFVLSLYSNVTSICLEIPALLAILWYFSG